MARGELILRQWNLLRTLQTRGQGIPLRDLAEEFNVSERTIQRDLEILAEVGFPIGHEEDDYGKRFWRLPHDFFRTGPLVVGLTEAISLHLADRLLIPLAGTLFTDGLQSLLAKIRASVPRTALDYFAGLDGMIIVRRLGQTDYSAKAAMIRVLTEAVRTERSVTLSYRALWKREQYTTLVDPYGLVLYDGDLFLVARSHRADDLRSFKVARILAAEPTNAPFERPDDFSLEDHFRTAFGIMPAGDAAIEVCVKFTGGAAGLVEERMWHSSQKLEWLEDEATLFPELEGDGQAVVATFRLGNLVEFRRWLRGFGVEAEVVRPASLREELRQEYEQLAARYRAKH
jgi:proteasome accessory factor B